MKLIKQSYEIFGETPLDYESSIRRMELAGRKCYKSEHRISATSAPKFIGNIVNHNHLSVVEHSNFVIRTKYSNKYPNIIKDKIVAALDSKYITVIVKKDYVYIGGSCRAFLEKFNIPIIEELYFNWKEYLKELFILTGVDYINVIDNDEIPFELQRVTISCITDRAVLAEFTRHRPDIVFSVESQRYCAYSNHLVLVIPHHYYDKYDLFVNDLLPAESNEQLWLEHMRTIEELYQFLIAKKIFTEDEIVDENTKYVIVKEDTHFYKEKAEEARSILPNSTSVDMIVTANLTEWKHIFNLRTSPAAYKQFRILMDPVKKDFINEGWY